MAGYKIEKIGLIRILLPASCQRMKKLGNPVANSDVLNRQPKVLLIGYGWVGQFVHKYFTEADIYTAHLGHVDKNLDKKLDDQHYDIAFLSVPTPMKANGGCDTFIVEEMVDMWKGRVDLFIIRSTVEIVTTDFLREHYNVNIVMQPEYIGETLAHPLVEPARDPF